MAILVAVSKIIEKNIFFGYFSPCFNLHLSLLRSQIKQFEKSEKSGCSTEPTFVLFGTIMASSIPAAPSATQRKQSEDTRIKYAVLEFLRYHGMKNSMECFEVESQQKLKESNEAFSPRSGGGKGADGVRFRVKRDMLACFEDGLSGRFFSSWDKNVPMDLRDKDKTCQKLEFYVQLHFATLPFRPSFLRKMAAASRDNPGAARSAAGAAASAMLNFRKYLESRGKILSSSPEFLQYYALPYVFYINFGFTFFWREQKKNNSH